MKTIRKFLLAICLLTFTVAPALSKNNAECNSIENIVKNSDIAKNATVAVSVKNVESGNTAFEINQDKLLHPASTMKLFSTPAAISSLGTDYSFTTQLFIDKQNNVYVKLGADPLLTSKDLKLLIRNLKATNHRHVNNVYIDDSVVDREDWGTGWMWDDATNPLMPKFSAYNLDDNLLKVLVSKDISGYASKYELVNLYNTNVVNMVKVGSSTNISVVRYDWQSPDIVELEGTVNAPVTLNIPISNMRKYFLFKLSGILTSENIKCKNSNFDSVLVPQDAKLIGTISHNSKDIYPQILQNSSNKMSETLCKVAASKLYNATATNELTEKMIIDFYNKLGLKTDTVKFADASGVSRNDLLTVGWMTDALNKVYSLDSFSFIKSNMAQPGDGTLLNRLYDLRGNVWLKTGTISGVSGITGFVKSNKDGKVYSVAILIQNFTKPQSDAKKLEDSIIEAVSRL